MPTTYDRCDKPDCDVYDRVRAMMEKHHPELVEADVLIQCLFANSGDYDQPAVKAPGGWPALALIRIVPLRQRVAGFKDAEILIDEQKWYELTEPQRDALIDHELQHLEVQYEGNGPGTPVKTDDWNRPKLKIRKHDWELAGFKDICERHPDAAIEGEAAREFQEKFGQYVFGGAEAAA